MTNHSLTEQIPSYLKPYIAEQDASLYTPMDHASWRYIIKISRPFFSEHAHQKYLAGLQETGISVESIPLIRDMDERLRKFNWRAVPVTGFIPPAVFMEFLSLGILPIACDMRTIDHLAYTPAPDIVHEAAGHAPIIADLEYREYLRGYGEISQKAIFSKQDMKVYQAIRELSIIKEDPKSSEKEIDAARERLDQALENVTYVSEATLLSRMGWWTFEYGLVGDMSRPKIYGAGLLSSIAESFHCIDPQVKKIPFTIDCIHTSYDITRPQPQLYVAPDFNALTAGLKQLENQMAFKKGGVEGLEKALEAETITTTVLNTGVQVSGVLSRVMLDSLGRPCYMKFSGPTQISYQDSEIDGQGPNYHQEGFGSPLESIQDSDLRQGGFDSGKKGLLRFDSGVSVEGKLVGVVRQNGIPILLTFNECAVRKGDEVLFLPEWGNFDMVCGKSVVSVFGGAADREKFLRATGGYHQEPGKQKTNLTVENRDLNVLYSRVRRIRESSDWSKQTIDELTEIYEELEAKHPKDWLLRFELLELCVSHPPKLSFADQVYKSLVDLSAESPEKAETIRRGLDLLLVS